MLLRVSGVSPEWVRRSFVALGCAGPRFRYSLLRQFASEGGPVTIRVLIADDHLVVRQGLRMFLSDDAGVEVVGEAPDGAEIVAMRCPVQRRGRRVGRGGLRERRRGGEQCRER